LRKKFWAIAITKFVGAFLLWSSAQASFDLFSIIQNFSKMSAEEDLPDYEDDEQTQETKAEEKDIKK
jgi:hypothetical protein